LDSIFALKTQPINENVIKFNQKRKSTKNLQGVTKLKTFFEQKFLYTKEKFRGITKILWGSKEKFSLEKNFSILSQNLLYLTQKAPYTSNFPKF
jgi:hypothetical protein